MRDFENVLVVVGGVGVVDQIFFPVNFVSSLSFRENQECKIIWEKSSSLCSASCYVIFSYWLDRHWGLLRPPHTSRFFVVELQIFYRGQIRLKVVGPSACLALVDFCLD